MKNSKSYKEERAEVIEKMEGLVASAEGRDLSNDEQSNFDSLNEKVEELNKMAVRAESFEKLQATKAVKEVTENTPSEVRDYSFQDAMNQTHYTINKLQSLRRAQGCFCNISHQFVLFLVKSIFYFNTFIT